MKKQIKKSKPLITVTAELTKHGYSCDMTKAGNASVSIEDAEGFINALKANLDSVLDSWKKLYD